MYIKNVQTDKCSDIQKTDWYLQTSDIYLVNWQRLNNIQIFGWPETKKILKVVDFQAWG